MTISVVIPTYRSAAFIGQTLTSVFAQTRPPVEVVVVDDGSPDDTVAAVERIAAAAPVPVRVIALRENSGGPARPLNVGIAVARGEFISPLDHDDLMEPDKLEAQAAAAGAGVGLVWHRCAVVGESQAIHLPELLRDITAWLERVDRAALGPDTFRIGRRDAYSALVRFNYSLSCSALLFPRAVWGSVGGFEPRFRTNCDYAFLQRVTARWDVACVDRPLVRWRRQPDTFTDRSSQLARDLEYFQVLSRFRRSYLLADDARRLDDWLGQARGRLLGWAYQLREGRQPARALAVYWSLLRQRPGFRPLVGAAKAVAACVTGGKGR